MSWQASKQVWQNSKQTGGLKLTLLAIADFASPQNGYTCEASIETLANMIGVSERQVKKNLKTLEDASELVISRNVGRGNTNIYSLEPLLKGEPRDIFNEQEKVNSSTEKVNQGAIKGEPQDTQTNITNITKNNITREEQNAIAFFEGMTAFTQPHETTMQYTDDWLAPVRAILKQSADFAEAEKRITWSILEMRRKRYTIKSPKSILTMALNWQPALPNTNGHTNGNGRSDDVTIWNTVLKHARNGDTGFTDPAMIAAVRAFGWRKLQDIKAGDENFYRKDFLRIYHEQSTTTA